MAAQQLWFCTSGARPGNTEPGLNSAPGCLPWKPRAASGKGVQKEESAPEDLGDVGATSAQPVDCRRLGKIDGGAEKRREMPQANYTKKDSV